MNSWDRVEKSLTLRLNGAGHEMSKFEELGIHKVSSCSRCGLLCRIASYSPIYFVVTVKVGEENWHRVNKQTPLQLCKPRA